MPNKTVNVSIKPLKIFFIVLIIAVIAGIIYFVKSKSQNTPANDTSEKEIVLPLQTGVADSGFEGLVTNFVALNAKAAIDAYGKIDGASSLKISFSDQPIASVKIPAYLDNISSGDFYRLGFWAKNGSQTEKQINLRIAEKDKTQDLGKFTLHTDDASYFEFTFQAENDAEDLILTSGDAAAGNVWIDDVLVEKLNVSSGEELRNLKPAVFGDTTWKNIDQSQDKKNGNSEDFLAAPNRKIGQIFQPTQSMLSGIALRVTRAGTGGAGIYSIQLREFNQDTGVISNDILASTLSNFGPDPETAAQIKEKEAAMRSDFAQREQDIKTGIIPQDKNEDHYPDTFTQDQIDAAKAAKRAAKLENDIHDMKESFNQTQEYDIPLAAKLDSAKKYWIGIDNAGVTVDQNNYISVSTASAASDKENESAIGGFTSKISGTWENSDALWLETFYPKHSRVNDVEIMSGATISNQGSSDFIYRYAFAPNDSSSASGFSGRKIYDMLEGNYISDIYGNYTLSNYDDYALYQFNALYPIQKIIIRNAQYHQSLALEISLDKENWEEIYSENPAVNGQTTNPIVFTPKESGNVFYLRIKSAGDHSTPPGLNLEAELAAD
ncbi:MAG: carbohydrate binding domain-containing protein [Parcubacteria group bacterium]